MLDRRPPLIRSPRPLQTASRFRRRRVGHFMLGDPEADTGSTTFVSNVAHPTPQVNVNPQVRNSGPVPTTETNKPILLLNSPVTLVRMDRLDFLLHGYAPALKQFLIEGFLLVFQLSLWGKGVLSNPLI